MKKSKKFDEASAISKVRQKRIKMIKEDCNFKNLTSREDWIIKKIVVNHLGYGYANYPRQEREVK